MRKTPAEYKADWRKRLKRAKRKMLQIYLSEVDYATVKHKALVGEITIQDWIERLILKAIKK